MKPYLSIITVTRNNANGLRRTLNSLRQQSYGEIEVVVIDGNSTDHTNEVLAEFADVVTIAEQDAGNGIYAAMNQGIQRSSREWLFFLNSGDVVHDDAFSKVNPDLLQAEPSIIYGATVCEGRYKPTKCLDQYWQGSRFSHQAVFIHRTLIEKTGYDTTFRILGDYNFLSGSYAAGIPFREIDLIIADIEPGGVSFSPTIAKTREYIRAGKQHFPDQPVARHQVMTYLNHKFLIRRRIYQAGQFFWKIYHKVRGLLPRSVRKSLKAAIGRLRDES